MTDLFLQLEINHEYRIAYKIQAEPDGGDSFPTLLKDNAYSREQAVLMAYLRGEYRNQTNTGEPVVFVDRDKMLAEVESYLVALPEEQSTRLYGVLDQAFSSIVQALADFDESEELVLDTHADPVLRALMPLLHGRIGPPMKKEDHQKAVNEGVRRIGARIPPGYMDKKKDDQHAVGDYLIWEQVIRQAEEAHQDVLLVTGDVKEDWWRIEHRQTRRPRPELVDELMKRAKVRLFMMRPDTLLKRAKEAFDIEISDRSLRDVQAIDAQFDAHPYVVAVAQALRRNEYSYSHMAVDGPFDFMVEDTGGRLALVAIRFIRTGLLQVGDIQAPLKPYRRKSNRTTLGCLVVTIAPLSADALTFNSEHADHHIPVEVITWNDTGDDGLLVRALSRTARTVTDVKLSPDDTKPQLMRCLRCSYDLSLSSDVSRCPRCGFTAHSAL